MRKGRGERGQKDHSWLLPALDPHSYKETSPASSLHVIVSTDTQTALKPAASVVWPRWLTRTCCKGLSVWNQSSPSPYKGGGSGGSHFTKAAPWCFPALKHHVPITAFQELGYHRVAHITPWLLGTDGPASQASPKPHSTCQPSLTAKGGSVSTNHLGVKNSHGRPCATVAMSSDNWNWKRNKESLFCLSRVSSGWAWPLRQRRVDYKLKFCMQSKSVFFKSGSQGFLRSMLKVMKQSMLIHDAQPSTDVPFLKGPAYLLENICEWIRRLQWTKWTPSLY